MPLNRRSVRRLHRRCNAQALRSPSPLAGLFQAVYVPADDITDPAPATTFSHLDATKVLDRSVAESGIYPAVDVISVDHYNVAQDFFL